MLGGFSKKLKESFSKVKGSSKQTSTKKEEFLDFSKAAGGEDFTSTVAVGGGATEFLDINEFENSSIPQADGNRADKNKASENQVVDFPKAKNPNDSETVVAPPPLNTQIRGAQGQNSDQGADGQGKQAKVKPKLPNMGPSHKTPVSAQSNNASDVFNEITETSAGAGGDPDNPTVFLKTRVMGGPTSGPTEARKGLLALFNRKEKIQASQDPNATVQFRSIQVKGGNSRKILILGVVLVVGVGTLLLQDSLLEMIDEEPKAPPAIKRKYPKRDKKKPQKANPVSDQLKQDSQKQQALRPRTNQSVKNKPSDQITKPGIQVKPAIPPVKTVPAAPVDTENAMQIDDAEIEKNLQNSQSPREESPTYLEQSEQSESVPSDDGMIRTRELSPQEQTMTNQAVERVETNFADEYKLLDSDIDALKVDFYSIGPGLVYNCANKHWACVDEVNFKKCKTSTRKAVKTCHPIYLHTNRRNCNLMQIEKINLNSDTSFCAR